jgi:hypothetical protein
MIVVLLCLSMFSILAPKVATSTEPFSLLWSRNVSPHVQGMAVDDINQDSKNEIVYADWSGWVYAVDSANNNLWTFKTGWYSILRTGDLNHDGINEVVVASADHNVYCINGITGGQIWKFPTAKLAAHGNLTLVDVYGDGDLEVVGGEWDSSVYSESPANVYVIDSAGNKVWDYSFPDDTITFAEDLDDNGKAEVVVYWGRPQLRSEGYVTMLNSDGSLRWSTSVSGCAWGGILFVDVNDDGVKETIATRTSDNAILIFNSNTGTMEVLPNNYGGVMGILGNRLLTYRTNMLYALDFSGNKIWEAPIGGNPPPGFPYLPTADLNGDDEDEILAGSDSAVHVVGSDGSVIWNTPSSRVWDARIGDIDGDGHPDIVIGSETALTVFRNQMTIPALAATVDIDPNSLNLRSEGQWITCYIELPESYNVQDIDVSSIQLNTTVSAEVKPTAIGDYDNDSIPDLMVKFDRAEVISYILANVNMNGRFKTIALTVTGKLYDDTQFQGSDTIKIIACNDSMPHGRAFPK